ncbi:DNA-directed RNA polymerase III subunit rpc7 [Seiridium cupressi]|uniref:DNA-directed RNA polymerase III subunit n=1 Tax=Seiridium unicorne TaxID=138068 RepID=A0ABR2VAE7_9PEZI
MAARGGRGGGRGGRGGARGGKGGSSGLPWEYDPTIISDQPQETYPKTYRPPLASSFPLTNSESRSVRYFVKLRRDFHNSPLYTHKHLASEAAGASSRIEDPVSKTYGQEQVNERYGIKSKATVDPFTAVPMFTHQFVSETRTMPYLRGRTFYHDLFPEELWPTLDGKDGGPAKDALSKGSKRKSMAGDDPLDDEDEFAVRKRPETDEERRRRIEEAATGRENEDDVADEDPDDEEAEMSQADDDFEDDEDGGDYDAEQYFENGDDDVEDDGGGGGDEY